MEFLFGNLVLKIDVYRDVLRTFLSTAKEKYQKNRRLSGRGATKLGKSFAELNLKYRRVFCNPLPLKDPPLLLAEGERWWRNAYKYYEFNSWY